MFPTEMLETVRINGTQANLYQGITHAPNTRKTKGIVTAIVQLVLAIMHLLAQWGRNF